MNVSPWRRELLECDPADDDRIQTALVNLDIQLDHISWHIRELKRPLKVPHVARGTTQHEKRGAWRRISARRRERGRITFGAESPPKSLTLATRSTTHCRHL